MDEGHEVHRVVRELLARDRRVRRTLEGISRGLAFAVAVCALLLCAPFIYEDNRMLWAWTWVAAYVALAPARRGVRAKVMRRRVAAELRTLSPEAALTVSGILAVALAGASSRSR